MDAYYIYALSYLLGGDVVYAESNTYKLLLYVSVESLTHSLHVCNVS